MDGNAGRYHPMPAWTHFVPNYNSFDFFDLKFDHLFYLKKLCKYSQIYVIFKKFISKAIHDKRNNILYNFLNKISSQT